MISGQSLIGTNLLLRTLKESEVGLTYLGWMNDREVTRYLEVRFSPPSTVAELQGFVREQNRSISSILFGIFAEEGTRHIGNIKLGPILSYHGTADVGLLIGEREYWGRGFATEAIRLLSRFGLETLGLYKLTAGCYAENLGSYRAFLKAGWHEEGRMIAHRVADGRRQDDIFLACFRTQLQPTVDESR